MTSHPAADHRGGRIAHILAQYRPYRSGYVIRSWFLLRGQRAAGWDPYVITSPFYPGQTETEEEGSGEDAVPHFPVWHPTDAEGPLPLADRFCRMLYRGRKRLQRALRGLRGTATPGPAEPPPPLQPPRRPSWIRRLVVGSGGGGLLYLEERLLLRRFARQIGALVEEHGAEVIHAHSPYRNALPAIRVGRRLGLPVVYEVRGLWEDSAVAAGTMEEGDPAYRRWRRWDTAAMLGADAVICLCQPLRDEVVRRGVPEDRVFVVPNAVDLSFLESEAETDTLPAALAGIRSRLRRFTVGYAGSLRRLEGLDLLLRGVARLAAQGYDIGAFLIGEGEIRGELLQLARRLEIADRVEIAGPLSHREVQAAYRLMDLVAIPRPDLRVTRMVTPLKPLEAMAMGKAVLASDLPALRELIEDGETGLFHRPGDAGHWQEQCRWLMEHAAERQALGERARKYVCEHRTWPRALAVLPEVYRRARHEAEMRSAETGK